MQALTLADGRLTYKDNLPEPQPGPGEALIRLLLAGICSTDLEIVKGYAGFSGVLGHEFVGLVETAENPGLVGCRVVGGINLGCGHCSVCIGDGPEHCPARSVLGIINKDGAFADYLTLSESNLHIVPDDVLNRHAVFTEPLAAALRIREQIRVRPSDRILVIGPGRLGLLICQTMAIAGNEVSVAGRSSASLALPAEMGYSTYLVNEVPADSYQLVVEATGNEDGLVQALRIIEPLGTLVMKSTYAGKAQVDLTKIVVGEINVVGSRCGPFAPALRLLSEAQVNVDALIEAEYSLAEGPAAFEHAMRPGSRKVLLHP